MIPDSAADLMSWEKRAFAHLALTLADGTPQCTPLWFDYDGTHVIITVPSVALRTAPCAGPHR